MAIIGTFTKLNEGAYVGAIKTIALNVKVRFQKVATESDKGPDFRIYAGDIEFGAAWTRTSRDEREYLSVKLEDPSFVTPIYATLVAGEGCHNLVWSRSRSAD